MVLTTKEGQDSYNSLINNELFNKIELELGEITGFEIVEKAGWNELNYCSNGVQKQIISTDKSNKILLQCFIYCCQSYSHKAIIG